MAGSKVKGMKKGIERGREKKSLKCIKK